jgi:predicted alpha/beta hydrolase
VPRTYLGHSLGGQLFGWVEQPERFERVLADDELVSPEGIRRLYRLYAQAPVQFKELHPKDLGMRRIGHFGVFKASSAERLWPWTLRWLDGPAE